MVEITIKIITEQDFALAENQIREAIRKAGFDISDLEIDLLDEENKILKETTRKD